MDFIKGIEQVKIDPSGINFVGNGNITIDSEKITGDISLNGKVSITNDFDITGKTDFTGDVSLYGKTDFTGDVSINSDVEISGNIEISGNNKFVVTNIGNVGIGTTNPEAQLHIKNDTINNTIQDQLILHGRADGGGSGQSILFKNSWSNTGGDYGEWKLGSIAGIHDGTEFGGGLVFSTTASSSSLTTETTEHMRITHDGYVGVGTTSPDFPLKVQAVTTAFDNNEVNDLYKDSYRGIPKTITYSVDIDRIAWFDSTDKSSTELFYAKDDALGNEHAEYSAFFKGMLVIPGFEIFSDRRIKTDISLVVDDTALNQVNALESYEYNYVDPFKRKKKKTIGFIAQEVKEVIPNAYGIIKEFIPDEMRIITDPQWTEDAGKYYLNIPDLDMSGSFTGKGKFYVSNDPSGNDEVCKEVQIEPDKKTFVFDHSWNNVFFYGKEVSDFHTIDKNQIFALHHSAIQELDRKHKREVESKEEKIASLESRVESLEAFLLTVLSKQEQIITKNTELEKKIVEIESNSINEIESNSINEIESNSINEIESNSISEPENIINKIILL